MKDLKGLMERATRILVEWKGTSYAFGDGALQQVGPLARRFGESALVAVADLGQPWMEPIWGQVQQSLKEHGVAYRAVLGAAPNAPREDLYRIALQLSKSQAALIIALGGGSTIDASKAAALLVSYSPDEVQKALGVSAAMAGTLDPYFGVGNVSKVKESVGRPVMPIIAVQTAASSTSHLTKGSLSTDPLTRQKKLISDVALYPAAAVFDYSVMANAPRNLTLDGGLDGIAHAWEVLTCSSGSAEFSWRLEQAEIAMRLIVGGLQMVTGDPKNPEARMALGLGTDVAAYGLTHGTAGTHGPHLGSFSLVDVSTHGRACAILNPYYTVLFAEATQEALKMAAAVFKDAGYIQEDVSRMSGRDLGMQVARAMIAFSKELGAPTALKEVGATEVHLQRMLDAAKDPKLRMKLEQMPVPMRAAEGDVDRIMKPTLEAAFSGELERVPRP